MRALVVALAAIVLCGGCGERARSGGPVTIVFKHGRMFGDDPVPRLVAAFEARHPGIRVKTEALGSSTDDEHQFYVINLEGSLGHGRGPGFDVMMLDVIWVPEFARAGWLLDLTPLARARASWTRTFPRPRRPRAGRAACGRCPGTSTSACSTTAPTCSRGTACHRRAPTPSSRARCDVIREAERDPRLDGYVWQGKQYEGLVCNALEALWASGTTLLGPGGDPLPDTARAEAAFGRLRGWIDERLSPAWVSAADEELTRRAFGDGRAIFLRNWFYAMDLFEAAGSAVRGKVGIAPLPRLSEGTAAPGSTGGALLGVSRATRHPEAAVALARFLAGEDAQRVLAGGSVLPTRRALYSRPRARGQAAPHAASSTTSPWRARPRPVTPALSHALDQPPARSCPRRSSA